MMKLEIAADAEEGFSADASHDPAHLPRQQHRDD
jgi:hypothetical protein